MCSFYADVIGSSVTGSLYFSLRFSDKGVWTIANPRDMGFRFVKLHFSSGVRALFMDTLDTLKLP